MKFKKGDKVVIIKGMVDEVTGTFLRGYNTKVEYVDIGPKNTNGYFSFSVDQVRLATQEEINEYEAFKVLCKIGD